jgi:hypothetical protein
MRIPTRIGDVLILETTTGVKIHAVGRVTEDGQQHFHAQRNVRYVSSRAAAIREATALVLPDRRIFLLTLESGDWSEVSI